jgi:uncharacterized protein with von Willebrand factor type A (vWA) domain
LAAEGGKPERFRPASVALLDEPCAMNIETLLDYEAIIANRPAPVHLALRFTAPELLAERSRPIAFCVVLDRSGSMSGAPLAAAK